MKRKPKEWTPPQLATNRTLYSAPYSGPEWVKPRLGFARWLIRIVEILTAIGMCYTVYRQWKG